MIYSVKRLAQVKENCSDYTSLVQTRFNFFKEVAASGLSGVISPKPNCNGFNKSLASRCCMSCSATTFSWTLEGREYTDGPIVTDLCTGVTITVLKQQGNTPSSMDWLMILERTGANMPLWCFTKALSSPCIQFYDVCSCHQHFNIVYGILVSRS